MENQSLSPVPIERRLEERRLSSLPTTDAEIWIIKTKVDMLTDSLIDIKETLKRIVEIAGVISVIEINAKQLSKESASLATSVSKLQDQVDALEKTLAAEVLSINNKITDKVKAVQTELEALRADWKEKYNLARGVGIAVIAAFAIFSGVMFAFVKSYADKVDSTYIWADHHRLEQELRDKESSRKASQNKIEDPSRQ